MEISDSNDSDDRWKCGSPIMMEGFNLPASQNRFPPPVILELNKFSKI